MILILQEENDVQITACFFLLLFVQLCSSFFPPKIHCSALWNMK